MDILLVTGFLGAGKTTLVARLLAAAAERRTAVIVNEFGTLGIDGEILRGRAADIVELADGCICCALRGPLRDALEDLATARSPDLVIVEASGVAEPAALIDDLVDFGATLCPVTAVVDAGRIAQMLGTFGPFYRNQIAVADTIVLNKADLVSPAILDRAERSVRQINPRAHIHVTSHCDVASDLLLDGPSAPRDAGDGMKPHVHVPAVSLTVNLSRVVPLPALEALFATAPQAIWRAKGTINSGDGDILVQFAGGRLDLSPWSQPVHHRIVLIGPELAALQAFENSLLTLPGIRTTPAGRT